MDLSTLPAELTWKILEHVQCLQERKNASLVCKSWNRMLFTSTKAQQNINLRIFSRNRGPAEDEELFNQLFEIMTNSERNYANIEFFHVNFELPVAKDFLYFIVTVCSKSIKRLKFTSCQGLFRSDLLTILNMVNRLEDLHVLNRIGYDGLETEEFELPMLRKVSLHVHDNCQFYQDVCVLAPNLEELELRTRDGFNHIRRDMATIERFSRQLKRLCYISDRALTNEEYCRLECPELVELHLKVAGTINPNVFKQMNQIRTIKLEGNVTNAVICAISENTALENLTLFCSGLYHSHKFVQLTRLQNMKTLNLRGIKNYTWKNVLLPNLQQLHVDNTGSNFIGFIKQSQLKSLEIHDSGISNNLLKRICRYLPELIRLELAFCDNISDGGLKNLNQLHKLTELRLWGIKASSELFKRYRFLPVQKMLIYFNDEINDSTLHDIGSKLTQLKQVVFYDCYKISLNAVGDLKKKLQACEVLDIYRGDQLRPSLTQETHIYNRNAEFPHGVLKQELPFTWY